MKDADEIVLTLADGTQNLLADGATYAALSEADTPDAAIFCEDDITIGGEDSSPSAPRTTTASRRATT